LQATSFALALLWLQFHLHLPDTRSNCCNCGWSNVNE